MANWNLYGFTPSPGAAGFFAAMFMFIFVALVAQFIHQSKRYSRSVNSIGFHMHNASQPIPPNTIIPLKRIRNMYLWLFAAALLEFGAYVARAISNVHQDNLSAYIVATVFVLVAPTFIAATIYMLFGRMLHLLECHNLTIVPSRFHTTVFVTADVISFWTQCIGGGMTAEESLTNVGKGIATAGLFIQIVVFAIFMISQVRFTRLAKRNSATATRLAKHWETMNALFIVCSILIFIRSVFKVAEFLDGFHGYMQTHEAFLYVFDALFMFAVLVILFGCFFKNNIFLLQWERILDSQNILPSNDILDSQNTMPLSDVGFQEKTGQYLA